MYCLQLIATLEQFQPADDEERACWIEGLIENRPLPLPESAVVSVTTRQVSDNDGSGHLISLIVESEGRELCRHFIFINFIIFAIVK